MRTASSVLFGLLYVTSISTAAPQERFSLGDMFNGIAEAVSGKQYDSPPYQLIATHDGEIEERLYEGGKFWACTEKTITATDSDSGMFMTLFRYITGANEGEKKISMTSPVSMKMTKHTDESFTKEMCFYLDSTYQSNPPQPKNTEVYLLERPAMTIYTRKVGGYMDNDDWFAESAALDVLLEDQGMNVNKTYFFANGYDSPMKFWNRRNEVWKVKL